MASMRGIKRRKESIQSTQQITKAMKLVSTVKLQRSKTRAEQSKDYFQCMYSTVKSMLAKVGEVNHPYLQPAKTDKKGIITAEEYMSLKTDCNNKLEKLDEEIKATREKIKEQENGMENNSFVESFKKLGNIEKLTRPLIVELIEEILVHEGGKITIRLKCKDAFEQVTEYIRLNKETEKTA